MPIIALSLLATFAVLGFGWRSWVQRRRTGSTGFRGISGRPGSVEWIAGAGFVVAFAIVALAPVLQLFDVVVPLGALQAAWIQILGVFLAGVGIAGTLYSQLDMGDSWRIGVDHTETTTLIHSGAFAVVRNPIFTAMVVFAFGIMLVTPNLFALIGFALVITTIELQVRTVEEPYLKATHGDAYRDYLATVGRFIPGVGRVSR